jgi:hypothetical protein
MQLKTNPEKKGALLIPISFPQILVYCIIIINICIKNKGWKTMRCIETKRISVPY